MIVLCPKCKTQYRADEAKIPETGLKLRCSKCTTIFLVRKRPAAPAAAPPPPSGARPTPPVGARAPSPATPPPGARVPSPAPPRPAAAPAKPAAAPPKPAPAPVPVVGPIAPAGRPKATVLIADAEVPYLQELTDQITGAGYAVYQAQDGPSALAAIKTKKPQIAIVEVALPGMFGFQISEQVKSDPALRAQTRVILIGSVYEKDRFRREPTSLYGADEYIEKHHDGPMILAKIAKLLAPPAPARPAAPPLGARVTPPATPPRPAAPPVPKPAAAPAPRPPAPAARPIAPPAAKPIAPPAARPIAPPAAKPIAPPAARPIAPPAAKPIAPPAARPVAPPAAKPIAPPATRPVAPPAPPKPTAAPAPPARPAAPPPPKPAAAPAPAPAKPSAPPLGARVPPPAPAPAKPGAPSAIAAVAAASAGIPADPGHQKAARLARTIVADIALYNPDEVVRGVKEGNLRELLAKDLDDGKKHYKTKVSPEIQAEVDYFEVAINGLIDRKKKELGLN